jgi:hypothetical protein
MVGFFPLHCIVCQASMPHSSQVVQPAGFMVYVFHVG